MENLKEILKNVKDSNDFKKMIKESPELYLVSFFKMSDNEDNWQIDFYNSSKDTMTSFSFEKEVKLMSKESKIFKEEGVKIDELNLELVKIELSEAINTFNDIIMKKYSHERIGKKIILLQSIEKPIWNLTYLTNSFNILNARINAESGEVISESNKPALSMI